jgi:hypothetical protein
MEKEEFLKECGLTAPTSSTAVKVQHQKRKKPG